MTAPEIVARLQNMHSESPDCLTYSVNAPGWPKITVENWRMVTLPSYALVAFVETMR